MTVYARSDVMYTAPSAAHGGCGRGHGRPVEHGAPVKIWALDCPQCENHLRHDDQWSVTVSGIPETPDETAEREEREKRGQQEATAATGSALQEIAKQGGTSQEIMTKLVEQGGFNQQMMMTMLTALTERGVLNALPASVPTTPCANDHDMPLSAKFCAECGAPPAEATPAVPLDIADLAPADTPDFEAMGIRELQTYAAQHGVKTTRAKADQIQLILAAQS